MATTDAPRPLGSLDERTRGLVFEMAAVSAWLILPLFVTNSQPLALRRLTAQHDPAGWHYLEFIALHAGQIAALIYIMWNSGDRLSSFGLTEPRRRDFVAGIGLVLLAVALRYSLRFTPWASSDAVRASLPHTASYNIEPKGTFALVNACLLDAIGALAFVGVIYSRLEELTGNWIGAAVMAAAMYCFWSGYDAGLPGTMYGLVMGGIFVTLRQRVKSVTPSLIYLASLYLILILRIFPE